MSLHSSLRFAARISPKSRWPPEAVQAGSKETLSRHGAVIQHAERRDICTGVRPVLFADRHSVPPRDAGKRRFRRESCGAVVVCDDPLRSRRDAAQRSAARLHADALGRGRRLRRVVLSDVNHQSGERILTCNSQSLSLLHFTFPMRRPRLRSRIHMTVSGYWRSAHGILNLNLILPTECPHQETNREAD